MNAHEIKTACIVLLQSLLAFGAPVLCAQDEEYVPDLRATQTYEKSLERIKAEALGKVQTLLNNRRNKAHNEGDYARADELKAIQEKLESDPHDDCLSIEKRLPAPSFAEGKTWLLMRSRKGAKEVVREYKNGKFDDQYCDVIHYDLLEIKDSSTYKILVGIKDNCAVEINVSALPLAPARPKVYIARNHDTQTSYDPELSFNNYKVQLYHEFDKRFEEVCKTYIEDLNAETKKLQGMMKGSYSLNIPRHLSEVFKRIRTLEADLKQRKVLMRAATMSKQYVWSKRHYKGYFRECGVDDPERRKSGDRGLRVHFFPSNLRIQNHPYDKDSEELSNFVSESTGRYVRMYQSEWGVLYYAFQYGRYMFIISAAEMRDKDEKMYTLKVYGR